MGLLAAFLPVFGSQQAFAAGVVGDGNPVNCTEAALDTALTGGGLVTFNCGGSVTIPLTTTKTIALNTQIHGGNEVTLDMGNNDRHFQVNAGVTLELDQLRLENGTAAGDGGSILNLGTVTATEVTFDSNTATDDGGAIFNNGGIVNILGGSLFDNNTGVQGGAIANWSGGTLTVSDSTFEGNVGSLRGGALSNRSSIATFTNSVLVENRSTSESGGAIDNPEAGGTVNIISSRLIDNVSGNRGGAISNDGVVTITDSTLDGNSTTTNDGGAINHRDGATLTITRSTFSGNTTPDQGGAIFSQGTATIETSTFSGNIAVKRGGAILNRSQMTINNSTIAFQHSQHHWWWHPQLECWRSHVDEYNCRGEHWRRLLQHRHIHLGGLQPRL